MNRQEFLVALRKALIHLDDYKELRSNVLMQLLGQQESPDALQRLLLEMIEALRNDQKATVQRYYEILYYRYVEKLNQTDLAFQMGFSVRHLRREQNSAIEYLADHIKKRFPWVYDSQDELFPMEIHTGDELQSEISWLSKSFHVEFTDVHAELQRVIEDASVLAKHHNVEMEVVTPNEEAQVSVPPVLFRQTLLALLTKIIPLISSGRLQLIISRREHFIEFVMVNPINLHSVSSETKNIFQMVSNLLAPFGATVQFHLSLPEGIRLRMPILTKIPVLLIDDNPDARQLFQRYVSGTNYFLIATDEVANVVDLVMQNRVKAVIVDIMMPKAEGWDILAHLLHHPATQHIPVAICSILPQSELSELLGASLFLQKPVTRDAFLNALNFLTSATEIASR